MKPTTEPQFNIRPWMLFSLFNLAIVAALGVLMRYKIGFDFPYFNQKYLQEAHSHFAFAGWISQMIYVLMVDFLRKGSENIRLKPFRNLLLINLITAYGMLFSFSAQGYSVTSIILSSATIVIACIFTFHFFKAVKSASFQAVELNWFKASLWFNIASSAGTIYLAYMMTSRNFNEHLYLASVYFFLHFQYNGFFLFSCIGLGMSALKRNFPQVPLDGKIFWLFFISVIPAYLLSTLWAGLPMWLLAVVVASALVQVWALVRLFTYTRAIFGQLKRPLGLGVYLLIFVGIAFVIKILLQLGSTIPEISKLAFGFRPIVIAYLHLVLLAVISGFLIAFLYNQKLLGSTPLTRFSLVLFFIGIFLNELILAIQGIASFSYVSIPHVNGMLFAAAIVLFAGAVLLFSSQRKIGTEKIA